MKYEYNISGIACGGCIQNVIEALKSIPGVRVEKVQKEAPQAVFYSEEPVEGRVVQAALSGKGKYVVTGLRGV